MYNQRTWFERLRGVQLLDPQFMSLKHYINNLFDFNLFIMRKSLQILTILCLLVSSSFSLVKGQCTPDTTITPSLTFPGLLPSGCQGQFYDEVLTIAFPSAIPPIAIIDSVVLDTVINVPPGLSYECGVPNCQYTPGTDGAIRGCVRIFGYPLDTNASWDSVIATGTAYTNIGVLADDYGISLPIDLGVGADFTFTAVDDTVPFLADTTTGATNYSWDFGDGGTDSVWNPTHIYADVGTYTVCLSTSSDSTTCTGDTCMDVTVSCLPFTTGFTGVDSLGTSSFTNSSTGNSITGYSWDFGDGVGTSTDVNPVYVYTATGTYEVCLTATDPCQSMVSCDSISVVLASRYDDMLPGSVSVYPNPTEGVLNVEMELTESRDITISVVNLLGEVVKEYETGTVMNYKGTLNLSDLTESVYLVRFQSSEGTTIKRVMLK